MSPPKQALLWLPSLAWAGVILLLTLPPPEAGPELPAIPHLDKLVHFGAFLVQAALVLVAGHRAQRWSAARAAGTAFLASALFGAVDEGLQSLVPGRTCDPVDWVADAAGAALAAAAGYRMLRRWER